MSTDKSRANQYTADRSATPTTDSAINMSRSASSSDDESYQDKRDCLSLSIQDVADRMRMIVLQQSDSHNSESSTSDHTLKSTSTVATCATLSPTSADVSQSFIPHSDENRHKDSSSTAGTAASTASRSRGVPLDHTSTINYSRGGYGPSRQSSKINLNNQYNRSSPITSLSVGNEQSESVVGDEVELEIVFPVTQKVECL